MSVALTGCNKGDMNCDGAFDADDVPMFAQALSDPDGYESDLASDFSDLGITLLPGELDDAANLLGDVDSLNNQIDFDDIDEFFRQTSFPSQ